MFEVGKKYKLKGFPLYPAIECIRINRDGNAVMEWESSPTNKELKYSIIKEDLYSHYEEVKELKKYSMRKFLYSSGFSHNQYFISRTKLETCENFGEFILDFEIDEEENKIVNVSACLSSDT